MVGGGPGPGRVRAAAVLDAGLPGRPGRRAERPSPAAAQGTGGGRTARLPHRPRGCRPRDGWVTTVSGCRSACRPRGRARRGRWGCRRGWAGGPSAAQVGSECSRLAVGGAVTCGNGWWACQDLNLGPHPYQQSRAHRYADRRFPRSCATVGGVVMRCSQPYLQWSVRCERPVTAFRLIAAQR